MSSGLDAASAGTFQLAGTTVNRIGFGAMRLAGPVAFGAAPTRPPEQALAVLRRARELGVNHVDTAAFYFSGDRVANDLIRTALAPYDDDLLIAAKVGPARDASGEWLPGATPDQLRGQVEDNLRQLGRDHLDLVYLRLLGPGPLAEHFGALADLRDAGLVRHLGISSIRPHHLAEAEAIAPVAAVQNRYGVDASLDGSDEVLAACAERGIAFVPYFAIAGKGRESGRSTESAAVLAVAERHGATPAQVRLAWTLHRGPHVLAIPGTGSLDHLEENVAAAGLRLSDADLTALS